MNQLCELSIVTQTYLKEFDRILEQMMEKMTQTQLSGSISYNFIVQMIPHHQAAIQMSQNILKYTTDIPLQNIALEIISEQTKSISNMEAILQPCSLFKNSRMDLYQYQNRVSHIMETMFASMGSVCTDNQISNDFMREMIPHHQGAVEMSENALRFPICQGLRPILQAIILSQKRGILQMNELLNMM